MRYLIRGTAVAAVLALAVPANAQMVPGGDAWSGFYLGANLGIGWTESDVFNTGKDTGKGGLGSALGAGAIPGTVHVHDTGILGGGQVGFNWRLNPFWVLGFEADIDGTTQKQTVAVPFPGGGAFLPFTSTFHRDIPYLGTARARLGIVPTEPLLLFATGGLAYGETRISNSFNCPTCAPPSSSEATTSSANESMRIGWTVGGGAEFAISPHWSLKAEYLYADLGRHSTTATYTYGGSTSSLTSHATDTDNIFRVGVNYHFNAPPPPAPMPAAMPAPPLPAHKVFIVFFDWDKDVITPEGMAIVQQAADAYKAGAMVQLQVTGYTDRSGSPGYNQRLSERRANNVAKALAGMGVPPTQMAVSGRGENDNRVPTAPGVREPQNRRVEIVSP